MLNLYLKDLRLLSKADFDYLKIDSKRKDYSLMRVYYKKSLKNTGVTRIGISVSRKVGNAVKRNRLKRIIREIFRTSNYKNSGLDLLFSISPQIIKKSKEEGEKILINELRGFFSTVVRPL